MSEHNNIPIYYINLDESISRNNNMISQLKNYNYTRFTAIGIKNSILNKYNNIPKIRYTNLRERLACLLTHLYAIKKAYDNNLESVIIFEDDIDLTIFNHSYKKMDKLYRNIKNIDILQLFTSYPGYYNNLPNTLKIRPRHNINYGACGYIINRSGIKKIMKIYDPKNDKFNIEQVNGYLLADYVIYNLCRSYIINIPLISLISPYILPSTLDNDTNTVGVTLINTINYINKKQHDILKVIENTTF